MQDLFPHDSLRQTQQEVIQKVESALQNKKNLLMHAPTGLGKTASTIPSALSYALENDLVVFFLTSRHTQHKIAIDTLQKIKQKHNVSFTTADIIGKRWMCSQSGVEGMFSSEFSEYCKSLRESHKCEFYSNTKKKDMSLTVKAEQQVNNLSHNPESSHVVNVCRDEKLCPYEIAMAMAEKAHIVISDYNYVFHPTISQNFLGKINKTIEGCIIIVDEAHNLPERIREMMTQRLSLAMVSRAISEAKKHGYSETIEVLEKLIEVLQDLATQSSETQQLITKDEFISQIEDIKIYDDIINDLEYIAKEIRDKQKKSYLGSIAAFLESWLGEDEGYARILTKETDNITLTYRCLDPGLLSKPIFDNAYCSILMSGTLNPTEMYADILGIENEEQHVFENPFPKTNKLTLIVPETTTKYSARSEGQFKRIAEICSDIANQVPGNTAIFFPSYALRDQVNRYFQTLCKKTTLLEDSRLTKEEKADLLNRFEQYKGSGAVLLGAASGSFGEGVDFPGDLLKCVIVVGLPLGRPDLETKELISYYDHKFSRGWDYGYTYPAFIKCLQNAGRCIRSETDKGIIIFLDQRFTWQNYFKCFPKDMDIKITKMWTPRIQEFFSQ